MKRIGKCREYQKGTTLKLSQQNAYTRFKKFFLLVSAWSALFLFPHLSFDAAFAQSYTSPTLGAPTLTALMTGAATVEISWTPVSDAAGYELWVWWHTDPGWQRLGEGGMIGTSHTHSDLTAGRTYYYLAAALDSNGNRGQWSEQVSVALPAQSQGLVAPDLTATSAGSTAIDVSWNNVTGAVRYELWTWWDSDNGWQQLGGDSLTGTTLTHSNLTPGRTYYYSIAAIDSVGVRSAWSAQVNVTLPASATALTAPALTVKSNVTATVEMNWSAVTGAVSYQLWEWRDETTGWERLDEGDLTGTSFVRAGAAAGQTYYYAIAAVDSSGILGAWSQVVSVLVSESPAIPDSTDERATLVALYEATDGADVGQ